MRQLLLAGTAVTLLAVAVATELTLPSVAEDRLRDQLAAVGSVTSVDVSASPGLQLLFGSADRADVAMSSATVDPADLDTRLLTRADGVGVLDARINRLHAGPLEVRSVRLTKQGDSLELSGLVDADAASSLVPGAELTTDDGRLVLDLSALPLPLPLPGPLQLEIVPEDGSLVARPFGSAKGLLPTQPLLDRPELDVTAVGGRVAGNRIEVTARATVDDV